MLNGIYRSNRPDVLLSLPLVVGGLFLPLFLRPVATSTAATALPGLLSPSFLQVPWANATVWVLLVILISVQLAFLCNNADLLGRRTHLPALLFPLLLAVLGGHGPVDSALAGMPLVLAAVSRTLSIATGGRALSALFDAGLLLGLAALFYAPYTFLLAMVWASVAVIRPFAWRDYVVPVLGCAVVFYLAWATLHLMDLTPWYPLRTLLRPELPGVAATPYLRKLLTAALLVPLLLVAILRAASRYQGGVTREKNLRSSFMAFVLTLGVLIGVEYLANGGFPPVLAAVPMGVIASHAVLGTRRAGLGELATTLLIGLALWVQWGW